MPQTLFTLDALLALAGNPAWDLLVIGDGSGQGYVRKDGTDSPIGSASVSIDRQSGLRHAIISGVSCGTVNQAEALCTLDALRYDLYKVHSGRLPGSRRVVIFSDSEVTVKTGNGIYRPSFNPDIWASFDWFRQQGYQLTWFFVERNSNPLAVAIDAASKQGTFLSSGLEWFTEGLYGMMPYQGAAPVAPAFTHAPANPAVSTR